VKLIEADKVKRAMKDYWKAQVDKALTLIDGNEANKRINSYLEHNHELLKAIDELPSAEPDTTTHNSIPAKTSKNDGDETSGDCISRQAALEKIRKMQTYKMFAGDDLLLIDQAEAQTELMMLPSAQPERKTGHWVKSDMQRWYDVWLCSECGEKTDSAVMSKPRYKYCPMCGAKMERGEQDE